MWQTLRNAVPSRLWPCVVLVAFATLAASEIARAEVISAEARAEATVAAPHVVELEAEGYRDILVRWTWLGRLRIVAWREGQRREIILHPTTGEVLRDLTDPSTSLYADGDSDAPGPAANDPTVGTASSIASSDPVDGTVGLSVEAPPDGSAGSSGDDVTDPVPGAAP